MESDTTTRKKVNKFFGSPCGETVERKKPRRNEVFDFLFLFFHEYITKYIHAAKFTTVLHHMCCMIHTYIYDMVYTETNKKLLADFLVSLEF